MPACLTPRGRLKLARCVVEEGWPLRRAAERFQVSVPTAKRWADRFRVLGRPRWWTGPAEPTTHRTGPNGGARRRSSTCGSPDLGAGAYRGPARDASLHRHRVIVRLGLPKLVLVDQTTGEFIRREKPRRYEHKAPGDILLAFPFSFVMIGMCFATAKALLGEERQRQRRQRKWLAEEVAKEIDRQPR